MKKAILFFMAIFTVTATRAQFQVEYTQYFEKPILGQFTYMETGVPGLNPDWWYKVFHWNYRKLKEAPMAKATNRTAVSAVTMKEVEKADTMQKDLTKRAKQELMNVTSRSSSFIFADPATTQTRKDLKSRLEVFKKNINYIQPCGGTADDYDYWLNVYNCFGTAMRVLDEGYMPSGDRLNQYRELLRDLNGRNRQLIRNELVWNGAMEIKKTYTNNGKKLEKADCRAIATDCLQEWKACFGADGFALQSQKGGYKIR